MRPRQPGGGTTSCWPGLTAPTKNCVAWPHRVLAVNDTDLTIGLIELLAMVRAELGDVETSARLYGTAEAIREQANLPRPSPDAAHLNRSLAKSRGKTSRGLWHINVTDCRALSREDPIAEGIGDFCKRTRPDGARGN